MDYTDFFKKCDDVIKVLRSDLSKIRTGRANTSLIEDLQVEAYSSKMPISHLATITISDAHTIIISPWDKDKKIFDSIVTAIQKSDLGINPIIDNDAIRLNIPPITEERRKELVKLVEKYAENARISIRNIRRNIFSTLDKAKKEEKLPDDFVNKQEKDIENKIKEYIQDIDEIITTKKNELLSIVK